MKGNKMRASEKQLKPCPFCGGKIGVQVRDDEGNFKDEEYKLDPWSGLRFSIKHYYDDNEDCPIASHEDESVGILLYESEDELIESWNRRAGKESGVKSPNT
jgi:hypothetical protein